MLAAVLALRPVASQDSKDYVMEAPAVSGPFGGACELCGELLCVPHLRDAGGIESATDVLRLANETLCFLYDAESPAGQPQGLGREDLP